MSGSSSAAGRLRVLRFGIMLLTLAWLPVLYSTNRDGRPLYLACLLAGIGLALLLRRVARVAPQPVEILDVVLWNLVLFFLLVELGTRAYLALGHPPGWMLAEPDQLAYRLDPTREWLGRAPNSRGFYDEEFPATRPAGATRVVALGDSYLVGLVPYPENYVTLVDEALGDEVELLNLGVVHMAPRQYLEILQSDGLALQPDVVLLGIYVGNDIREDPPRGLLSRWGSSAMTVARHASIVLLESRFGSYAQTEHLFQQAPEGSRIEVPQLASEHYLKQELRHLTRLMRPPPSRRMRQSWIDTERAIAELVELCRARGIPVLATIAPDELQVSPRLVDMLVEFGGVDLAQYDLEYPTRRLVEGFAALGVPVLDLTPALREAERRAPTYHLRGTHWNRAGNAAVAAALTPWLASQLRAIRTADGDDR